MNNDNIHEKVIVKKNYNDKKIDEIKELYFLEPYYWVRGIVIITGVDEKSEIEIKIDYDNKTAFLENIIIDKSKITKIKLSLEGYYSIYIRWNIKNPTNMDVKVKIELVYLPDSTLKMDLCRWEDSNNIVNNIEELYLLDNHKWIRSSIIITSYKSKVVEYILTLIVDGSLKMPLISSGSIEDGYSKIYSYNIDRKAILLLSGYIINKSIKDSCANVTLIGYYRE